MHKALVILATIFVTGSFSYAELVTGRTPEQPVISSQNQNLPRTYDIPIPIKSKTGAAGILRLEVEEYNNQNAVTLYRVMSDRELAEYAGTHKWRLQPKWPYKSFSTFWDLSISDSFFETKSTSVGEYFKVVRVHVRLDAIKDLFKNAKWSSTGDASWRIDSVHPPTPDNEGYGLALINNVDRPNAAGPEAPYPVDELAFTQNSLEQLNQATLGYETFVPEHHDLTYWERWRQKYR